MKKKDDEKNPVALAYRDRAEIDIHDSRRKLDSDMKTIEERKKGMKATATPLDARSLKDASLSELEYYLLAARQTRQLVAIQEVMALYEIHKEGKFKEKGFDNLSEYCKAIGISKSAAYEWVSNVDNYGQDAFAALVEKVGLNLRFFRDMKVLPPEVRSAAVKGDIIEFNGREYDLTKKGKDLNELVKGLAYEFNKGQEKYDTSKQYKEKLSKKDSEIKALKERIESQGIPDDEREALVKIANLKVQLRGLIRIIEGANLDAYSDEIKAELQLLAQYAHDRGELCLGRVLERLGGVSYAPLREQAEADFRKKHGEDED